MKAAIALLLLALFVATTAAQGSSSREEEEMCQRELSHQALDQCLDFLRGTGKRGLLQSITTRDQADEGGAVPEECCRQMRPLREDCRCPMVRVRARQVMREQGYGEEMKECRGRCEEILEKGKSLPAMCDVDPRSCKMS